MRTAEVGNWTGLALVCPRTDLERLAHRPEARKTGVYILVGPSEDAASEISVYVGEGDEVWSRLASHDSNKDFWTYVVVFVSKDENLTKAHVRWLEATLVREIRKAKRAEIINGNEPTGGRLPEADTADMETYFDNVRLLLPTLGVSVFSTEADANAEGQPKAGELALELQWQEARAECVVRDGQFIVRAGSFARAREVESLRTGTRSMRKRLRDSGVLAPVEGNPALLRFTQEYAFDSPTAASAVIAAAETNGRTVWKVKGSGMTYKDWQEQQVTAASGGERAQSE
jgi:hypothetical protein